jgi:type I restriction enzyme S subunit
MGDDFRRSGAIVKHLPADADRPEFAPVIDLPSGWSWVSAAEVCEIVASGSTPKPDEMSSGTGEVPLIKVYNLGFDGSLDFTVKPTFIRRAIHDGPLARSRCLPGDVLINIVGPPLGKVSLVPDDFPEWNINQAIVTFRAGPRIVNHLLAYWLMAPPVQRRIERTAKATAGQYNVQVSTCRKLVLPLPALDEQHRIVAEVDRRLSIVHEVEAEVDANLKHAQALRKAVLTSKFAAAGG